MLLKRKRKDDSITPLKGWPKFFHRLGRLLLYPLIRPVLTLFIVLVLFLAPTFRGVKPIDVPSWYVKQMYKICDYIQVWWGSKEPQVEPGAFKFVSPEEAAPAPMTPSEFEIPEPADETAPNILDVLRGTSDASAPEDTQKEDNTDENTQENSQENVAPTVSENNEEQPKDESVEDITVPSLRDGVQIPKDESLYSYPLDKKVPMLRYVDFPHEIVGKATVLTPNEIEINGEYIMLYGIYIHPYTSRGVDATKYLKDMINGQEIKCGIVAYTSQEIATGICYFGKENVNRDLVIKGYSKNVAL